MHKPVASGANDLLCGKERRCVACSVSSRSHHELRIKGTSLLMENRQKDLDALRGLAALFVVTFHYLLAFYPFTVLGNHKGVAQQAAWEALFHLPPFGLATGGHHAVSMFFILSGYVLSYRFLNSTQCDWTTLISNALKRPVRLGGVVLFTIGLSAILWSFSFYLNTEAGESVAAGHWFSRAWKGDLSLQTFLTTFFLNPFSEGELFSPPLWTIKIELYGSLLTFAFLIVFRSFRYRLIIAFILLLVFHDSHYAGFWIGIIAADTIGTLRGLKLRPYISWTCFALFFYLSAYPHWMSQANLASTVYGFLPNDKGYGDGYPLVSAVALFCFVLLTDRTSIWLACNSTLQRLGHISYSLYATHYLVLGSLASGLYLITLPHLGHGLSFVLVFAVGLTVSLLLATVVNWFVDQPSLRLSNLIGKYAQTALVKIGAKFVKT